MSISKQQYIEMRERVEDLLCKLDGIVDSLRITGTALSRSEAYAVPRVEVVRENPELLESCSQATLCSARLLKEIRESMLRTIPEILPDHRAA